MGKIDKKRYSCSREMCKRLKNTPIDELSFFYFFKLCEKFV